MASPKVNVAAASSISHGSRRMKLVSDVCTRSRPPREPPRLTAPRTNSHFPGVFTSRLYAIAEATAPGHNANVVVALAVTGAMPAKSSAGRAMNESAAGD